MLGDNPMQSEIACHVGLMGRMFCRVCKVSGKVSTGEGEENMDPAVDNQSDSASSVEASLHEDEEVEQANPQSKRPKKTETIAEAVRRVTSFMSVRAPLLIIICTYMILSRLVVLVVPKTTL
jgi:hypothetical protein